MTRYFFVIYRRGFFELEKGLKNVDSIKIYDVVLISLLDLVKKTTPPVESAYGKLHTVLKSAMEKEKLSVEAIFIWVITKINLIISFEYEYE